MATAQMVNLPDPNLRAKIEDALGKASDAPITTADMAKLTAPWLGTDSRYTDALKPIYKHLSDR